MTPIIRTGVEWIDTFSGPCKQNNLPNSHVNAEGFQNSMSAVGNTAVFNWGDTNAWETDFRSNDYGGDSLDWTDNVHFVYFEDHGGNSGGVFSIAFTAQHANCFGSPDQWKLGAKSLKWIVFDTCDTVLDTSVGSMVEWFGPMQGVHIVFGFVGISYNDSGRGAAFGNDAGGGDTLSNAWLDDAIASGGNQTAIAIAAGATQAEAINRRENECIPWRDYNVTATDWIAWKWYS